MFRKKNKLPAETHSVDFELEYGTATIEVHKDSIDKDDSVLIIDDLIATGGTAEAAAKLVEMSNAKIAAFVFAINLFDLGGSDDLSKQGLQNRKPNGLSWSLIFQICGLYQDFLPNIELINPKNLMV